MSHQPHEKVIYVISKQIQYIVIEPYGSCWAHAGDNWKTTELLPTTPCQHLADVKASVLREGEEQPVYNSSGNLAPDSWDEAAVPNIVTTCARAQEDG